MPRVLEKELEKTAKSYKAKTGAGCDGIHPNIPLDLKLVDFFSENGAVCVGDGVQHVSKVLWRS